MKKRIFKNMEWVILISSIILCAIGLVALFSATSESDYEELKKQIVWIGMSIIIMFFITLIDYENFVKFSWITYSISIILLIVVLFTRKINGATSWFNLGSFSLQPAEFGKVFYILFIAFVISKIQEERKENINKILNILLVLLITAVPVGLIILEPDYGTAVAYIISLIFILFSSGIYKRYIIISLLIVVIAVPLLYLYVIPSHAKMRIDTFLNPESDPRGAGYNILQSKLAIGSGGLTGMGVLNGNQTQLGYLYPKTTDFIYAVISEEMGFIISALIIILYVIIITRSVYIAKTAKDNKGAYIAIGIAGIFLFHMLENIGMTMGLLPITGVPLLFISYGGSSMITSFICIGLLLNISGRRQKAIFVK